MTKKLILAIGFATALFSFKVADPIVWTLDSSHAKLGFSISHMLISDVDGNFKKFDATITSKNADLSDAVAEMTVQVASINTDDEKRDEHLKNADFFDVEKYPTITFKSTSFKKTKIPNVYMIQGNLNMHGVTKAVTLNAIGKFGTNPYSKKELVGFKVTGKLKRADFKLATSTPNAILGEEVSIIANAEFVKG